MGYNDSKAWLDEQADTMHDLVEIVRVGGVSSITFDNSRDALRQQFYISNVKHGMQIHYPQYADVALTVRTWVDKDYANSKFTVHIGIPQGNYNRQRTGRSHQHRRMPPPTVQGRPPVPVIHGNMSPLVAYGNQATVGADSTEHTFELEDTQDEQLIGLVDKVRGYVKDLSANTIKFVRCSLEPSTVQQFMDLMPEWTVEDAQQDIDNTNRVTAMILRRKDVTQ